MAHSDNEYMRSYLKKYRIKKAIEKHKKILGDYTGRRKEIYEQLQAVEVGQVSPGLADRFRKAIRIPAFSEFKELLSAKGYDYDKLGQDQKNAAKEAFEKMIADMKLEAEKMLAEQLELFELQSELMRLKMTEEAIELKIFYENKGENLESKLEHKIRDVVKKTLWSTLIDGMTEQVKKELTKNE